MKQPRFLILLCNPGGELDRREARNEQSCKAAIQDLADKVAYFSGGDTISIIDRAEDRE